MERSALHRKLKSLKVHDLRVNRRKDGEEVIEELLEDVTEEAVA
jgi:hypothetical protein